MNDLCAVHARLDSLPRKVGIPFRKLLEVGQIDDDVVSTVLDAGELGGESHMLIAFTVGLLYLKSQKVPVEDVIRMAKLQHRKINLSWSANRWQQEHNRLSRAEALARLAEENVAYDVTPFEVLLPSRFNGYLIRTSRRLGMEGLRQRHCIASYHSQLTAGTCAITSVFVNRQRWTVQIVATGKTDAPLRISQIRTRRNELPSTHIRDDIYQMHGVEKDGTRDVAGPDFAKEHTYLENLRKVLPVLREHGIKEATVAFDGSGDSGSIGSLEYDVEEFDGTVEVDVLSTESQFDEVGGSWVRSRGISRKSLNDAIHDLTYDYLEEADVDWYNEDGGYGELVINVVEGTVSLDVKVRVVESEGAFYQERDITTDEIL